MIEYFDVEQGSEEWNRLRVATITASEFHNVVRNRTKAGELSKDQRGRFTYMEKLATEIVKGRKHDSDFTGVRSTERGKEQEPLAIEIFEIQNSVKVDKVGFFKNTDIRVGCSPDGIVGIQSTSPLVCDFGIEVKSKIDYVLVKIIREEIIPEEYILQAECNMLVTGCENWKIVIYSPELPLVQKDYVLTQERKNFLLEEIQAFNKELDDLVEKVKSKF